MLPLNMSAQDKKDELSKLKNLEAQLEKADSDTAKIRLLKDLYYDYRNVDVEKSDQYLEDILTVAEGSSDADGLGFYYLRKGVQLSGRGEKEAALEHYYKSKDYYQKVDDSGAIKAMAQIGIVNIDLGRYDKAEDILRSQIEQAQSIPDSSILAYLYNQMCVLYGQQRINDSTDHYANLSAETYQRVGDTLMYVRIMVNQGIGLHNKGKYQEAQDIFLMAHNYYESIGSKNDMLFTFTCLSASHKVMGNYYESLRYNQEGYLLCKEQKLRERELKFLTNAASIHEELKDYEKALELYEEADQLATEMQILNDEIYVKFSIGSLHNLLEEWDKAEVILRETVERVDTSKNKRFELPLYSQLALALMKKGEFAEAEKLLTLSEEKLQEGDERSRMRLDVAQATLNFERGNYEKAVYYGQRSYDWLAQDKDALKVVETAELLSMAYKKLGRYREALDYHEIFKSKNDSLLNLENVRILTTKTKDFEFQLEKKELATQQAQKEALLKAETRQTRTAAAGIAALAILGFGFFWNARQKNQTISEQNRQLEQLNQTKDRLFSIIGHDLRKPALAFQGIAKKVNYLLKRQDFSTLEKLGSEIEKDALSLNQLTDNLLNWALTQKEVMPYQPQAINLGQAVEEELDVFQNVASNKQVKLISNIPTDLEVYADANALRTIIRNLVDNALKFSSEGGEVKVIANSGNNGVAINIEDNGTGMPEEKLKDIFLLQKGKSQEGTAGEKGTGLGLHLVNELVKLNEGAIEVASQLGQGTKFSVHLPARALA